MFYTSTGYIISKDLKVLIDYGLAFHTTAATFPKNKYGEEYMLHKMI